MERRFQIVYFSIPPPPPCITTYKLSLVAQAILKSIMINAEQGPESFIISPANR